MKSSLAYNGEEYREIRAVVLTEIKPPGGFAVAKVAEKRSSSRARHDEGEEGEKTREEENGGSEAKTSRMTN